VLVGVTYYFYIKKLEKMAIAIILPWKTERYPHPGGT
jgi:hypothetical protein